MRRFGMAVLAIVYATVATAAELPSRKPGLWEVTMSLPSRTGPGQVVQQCIDAATDQMMLSSAGPLSPSTCAKREVQSSAGGFTIDSACTLGGKSATARAVVAGSFDNSYTMTVTAQSDALPGGSMTMSTAARWLGPCKADQKAGDMIFANGMKMNLLELMKRSGEAGTSSAPFTAAVEARVFAKRTTGGERSDAGRGFGRCRDRDRDMEKPVPKPNEVLIRVRASTLNRADLIVASGHRHGAVGGAGARIGLECAGEVEAVGTR